MKKKLSFLIPGIFLLVAGGAASWVALWRADASPFRRYCSRSRNSYDIYYGKRQFHSARRLLKSENPEAVRRGHQELGMSYLRFARTEEAIRNLEEALAMARDSAARGETLMLLATAHLKQAELVNCTAMHGPESCILPLSESARHRDRAGSEAAIARLTDLLEIDSDNAKARWLLTFAHNTLGTTPPEKWAVPLPESAYEIGHFHNVAPEAGIDVVNLAGGAAMDDFDNDGLFDIVTSDCDPCNPMHHWRNNGDGTFTDLGIEGQLGGLNLTHADYDNDGYLDLLVLRGGWLRGSGRMRVSLLRNRGDGTFDDVTRQAGLARPAHPTQTAAWADYDNDGDLDVYIGGEQYPCRLYRNDGGSFVDVARGAGVTNGDYTKGVAWGDYDNDGDPDLYVSNFGASNRLYRNDGGRFVDVAAHHGVEAPFFSFACWFFDYDNDGWLDLFVAGYNREADRVAEDMLGWPSKGERPRLYRNVRGTFVDVTRPAGLWRVWQPMGANFGDLDNDGLLDIYLGTGFPSYDSIVPNVMLRNAGTLFQDVTISGGFGHVQKGHGVAWGDIDNDGDQDIFVEIGGFFPGDGFRNALFINPGHGNHWVSIRLVGTRTNRFGVGARITARTGSGAIHRVVGSGGSFGGNSFIQHIGLGKETVRSLEVVWPTSGIQETFTDVPADCHFEITEGDSHLQIARRSPVDF